MFVSKFVARCLIVLGLAAGFAMPNQALAIDSFFDVFVDLMEEGAVDFQSAGTTSYNGFDTEMVSLSLRSSSSPGVVTSGSLATGDFRVDSFFDITYEIAPEGGGQPIVDSFFDVWTEISVTGPTTHPSGAQTFETEILSMDLSSAGDGGPSAEYRLGPILPHHGHVTVLKMSDNLGSSGEDTGLRFAVDSFFDVFTELSIDEGETFSPAFSPTHLMFSDVRTVSTPEPSSFVMASIALLGLCLYGWRRRR